MNKSFCKTLAFLSLSCFSATNYESVYATGFFSGLTNYATGFFSGLTNIFSPEEQTESARITPQPSVDQLQPLDEPSEIATPEINADAIQAFINSLAGRITSSPTKKKARTAQNVQTAFETNHKLGGQTIFGYLIANSRWDLLGQLLQGQAQGSNNNTISLFKDLPYKYANKPGDRTTCLHLFAEKISGHAQAINEGSNQHANENKNKAISCLAQYLSLFFEISKNKTNQDNIFSDKDLGDFAQTLYTNTNKNTQNGSSYQSLITKIRDYSIPKINQLYGTNISGGTANFWTTLQKEDPVKNLWASLFEKLNSLKNLNDTETLDPQEKLNDIVEQEIEIIPGFDTPTGDQGEDDQAMNTIEEEEKIETDSDPLNAQTHNNNTPENEPGDQDSSWRNFSVPRSNSLPAFPRQDSRNNLDNTPPQDNTGNPGQNEQNKNSDNKQTEEKHFAPEIGNLDFNNSSTESTVLQSDIGNPVWVIPFDNDLDKNSTQEPQPEQPRQPVDQHDTQPTAQPDIQPTAQPAEVLQIPTKSKGWSTSKKAVIISTLALVTGGIAAFIWHDRIAKIWKNLKVPFFTTTSRF